MSFHIGQKVICINDDPEISTAPRDMNIIGCLYGLKKGRIYTVRQVGVRDPYGSDEPCIRVYEIVRPRYSADENEDMPYLAKRFRPIVERETSIEVFKKMLKPQKQEA